MSASDRSGSLWLKRPENSLKCKLGGTPSGKCETPWRCQSYFGLRDNTSCWVIPHVEPSTYIKKIHSNKISKDWNRLCGGLYLDPSQASQASGIQVPSNISIDFWMIYIWCCWFHLIFLVVEDCTAGHGSIITRSSNITSKLTSLGSSPKGTLKPKKKRKFQLRTNPLLSKQSPLTTQPQLNEELRMKLQHCHRAPPKGLRQKWSPRIAWRSSLGFTCQRFHKSFKI